MCVGGSRAGLVLNAGGVAALKAQRYHDLAPNNDDKLVQVAMLRTARSLVLNY
jgi:hypothetical protein